MVENIIAFADGRHRAHAPELKQYACNQLGLFTVRFPDPLFCTSVVSCDRGCVQSLGTTFFCTLKKKKKGPKLMPSRKLNNTAYYCNDSISVASIRWTYWRVRSLICSADDVFELC